MEWGHRMWGRATGMVFLLPALYFLRKGWISKSLKPRLAAFAGLLGFQVGTIQLLFMLKKNVFNHKIDYLYRIGYKL